jgi:hypothetical protein
LRVDHTAATLALELHDGVVPGQPKVTVHLSEPAEDGTCELTISGSYHATEEGVATAIGLEKPQTIDRYTPSTMGHVVSEPGRPPSPGAAAASQQVKGRIVRTSPAVVRPPEQADLVQANALQPGQGKAKERK